MAHFHQLERKLQASKSCSCLVHYFIPRAQPTGGLSNYMLMIDKVGLELRKEELADQCSHIDVDLWDQGIVSVGVLLKLDTDEKIWSVVICPYWDVSGIMDQVSKCSPNKVLRDWNPN